MGYGRPKIRYFKWEKDRFSKSQTGLLWDDNNSPPECLQKIQFSENELCEKTREIIYLKFYPLRKTALFHQKPQFTEKKIQNIIPRPPLIFSHWIFTQNSSHSLCKITTGAVAIAPRVAETVNFYIIFTIT